jgi:hypothetical protein
MKYIIITPNGYITPEGIHVKKSVPTPEVIHVTKTEPTPELTPPEITVHPSPHYPDLKASVVTPSSEEDVSGWEAIGWLSWCLFCLCAICAICTLPAILVLYVANEAGLVPALLLLLIFVVVASSKK